MVRRHQPGLARRVRPANSCLPVTLFIPGTPQLSYETGGSQGNRPGVTVPGNLLDPMVAAFGFHSVVFPMASQDTTHTPSNSPVSSVQLSGVFICAHVCATIHTVKFRTEQAVFPKQTGPLCRHHPPAPGKHCPSLCLCGSAPPGPSAAGVLGLCSLGMGFLPSASVTRVHPGCHENFPPFHGRVTSRCLDGPRSWTQSPGMNIPVVSPQASRYESL